MNNPEEWLTLGCESCGQTYSTDDAINYSAVCPHCRVPLRPVVSLLIEAASDWPEYRARIIRKHELTSSRIQ